MGTHTFVSPTSHLSTAMRPGLIGRCQQNDLFQTLGVAPAADQRQWRDVADPERSFAIAGRIEL